jgi:hypothetical protein
MIRPEHYKGYDILCSTRGYTIIRHNAEVLTEAVDGASREAIVERAKRAIDGLMETPVRPPLPAGPGRPGWVEPDERAPHPE